MHNAEADTCVTVNMKWNDTWMRNKDCDGDGKLDRPSPWAGSGAYETNHMSGSYPGIDGKKCHWTYFVKIVAVPEGAYYEDTNLNGKPDDETEFWYTADGTEIGLSIWGINGSSVPPISFSHPLPLSTYNRDRC